MSDLKDLIDQAEREGKWLESTYQNIPFSPAELRRANAEGKFRWGPMNWRLIDPKSLLRDETKELETIRKHNDLILKRIKK